MPRPAAIDELCDNTVSTIRKATEHYALWLHGFSVARLFLIEQTGFSACSLFREGLFPILHRFSDLPRFRLDPNRAFPGCRRVFQLDLQQTVFEFDS